MAPPEGDVTLGELARRLSSMEKRIDDKFGDVNRRLDGLTFVPHDVHALSIKAVTDRLDVLEERDRWRSRVIVASFIFPVLVALAVALTVTR